MNSKYPRATAFLKRKGMTVDEALIYLEEQEKEVVKFKTGPGGHP